MYKTMFNKFPSLPTAATKSVFYCLSK